MTRPPITVGQEAKMDSLLEGLEKALAITEEKSRKQELAQVGPFQATKSTSLTLPVNSKSK